MRKWLVRAGRVLAVFLLMVLITLKVADMHRDGILFRDGWYYIRPMYMDGYKLDIAFGVQQAGQDVRFCATSAGANQAFYIKYVSDGKYALMFGDQNFCVGVNDDGLDVSLQPYEEGELDLWKIERIDSQQKLTFTNEETGKSLCFRYNEQLKYYDAGLEVLDSEDNSFYMIMSR